MKLLGGLFGTKDKKNQGNIDDIYENLGIVRPFTALDNGQMRSFIGDLSEHKRLTRTERKAFEVLWYTICPDIDGFGNNIWNLKEGKFEIFDEEGIKAQYEKESSVDIDEDFDEGRVNFTFRSAEGDMVVHQHERNKKIFLVYLSEKISERLFDIFREVETKTLDLKPERGIDRYKVKLTGAPIAINQSGSTVKSIDKKGDEPR